MNDEIEILKYVYTNLKMQQDMLYKILKKRERKDEIYLYIRNLILEYRKLSISARKMLENRIKKYSKEPNILADMATSLGARINISNISDNEDFLEFVKKNSEINFMDLNNTLKDYNIKSKTVSRLTDNIQKLEEQNIQKIKTWLNEGHM